MNKKLLEFQKKIQGIKKDAKNPHFKNNYATLTQILSEVKPILNEVGLVLLQPVINGKCKSIIVDSESDANITAEIDLPLNLNPQQLGSALTYYRRYLLAGLLSLELEDDDANIGSQPTKKQPLSNDQFLKAIERIKNGELDIIAKLNSYDLNVNQVATLNTLNNGK